MSFNREILYKRVRSGTRYLFQSSLLLSSFTHCYYTGLSVNFASLHITVCVCVCVFFFFSERCITCVCC